MEQKRTTSRVKCKLISKIQFDNDHTAITYTSTGTDFLTSGLGLITDISKRGIGLISSSRVSMDMPVTLRFEIEKKAYMIGGKIVRIDSGTKAQSNMIVKAAESATKHVAIQFNNELNDLPCGNA